MTDLKDLTEEAAIAGDTREIRVTRGQQRFASWVTDVLVYIVRLRPRKGRDQADAEGHLRPS